MASNRMKLHVVAGLASVEGQRGTFRSFTDHIQRLEIPSDIARQDVERAERDCEILGEKLRDHRDDMSALMREVAHGNFAEAQEMIKKLGLREEDFVAEGGGALWMLIIVVGLLYSTPAY